MLCLHVVYDIWTRYIAKNTNVNDIGCVAVRIQHICLVCHVSINRNSAVPVECHMYQCKLRSRPESICALYNTVSYTTVPITSQPTDRQKDCGSHNATWSPDCVAPDTVTSLPNKRSPIAISKTCHRLFYRYAYIEYNVEAWQQLRSNLCNCRWVVPCVSDGKEVGSSRGPVVPFSA